MKTLIKNGHIFTEAQDCHGDILIEDEKIVSIGSNLWGKQMRAPASGS